MDVRQWMHFKKRFQWNMDASFQEYISFQCSLINTNGTVVLSVTTVSCCSSILGAVAILYSYARLRSIRDDTRMLLLFLTAADLLTASAYLIGPIFRLNVNLKNLKAEFHDSPACVVQSFITTFSSLASFFWTFAIAAHIYCRLVYGVTYIHNRIVFLSVHILCWGAPGRQIEPAHEALVLIT